MGRWRRLLPYVRPHRRVFAAGLSATLLATAISLAAPWVLKVAVDDFRDGRPGGTAGYGALLVGLAAVGGLFRFLTRRLIVGASREIEYQLRNDFFAQLQRLHLGFLQTTRTGDLMSRATADLGAVRMMVGPAVMYTVSTGLTVVVAVALMLSIAPRLTVLALAPLPLVSFAVRYFGAAIHDRFERIQAQLSDVSAVTQESLAGIRVIRAYRQEAADIARFRRASEELVRRNRVLIALQGVYYPSMGFLMGCGALLVLWLGSRDVVAGRMTVGELVAFNAYLALLGWPMVAFGWVTNLLQRGMASWGRMLEVLDAEPAITDRDVTGQITDVAQVRGDLEIRGLTFGYGAQPVLHDLSIAIPWGTRVGIVGATGSGKSTLVHLLGRLYDPPPGTIFLDGVDVRHVPLRVLRAVVGCVPQEPFLFGGTLAENIAMGVYGGLADRADVERAAATAGLDGDVSAFPLGYDTVVGERGITLSGGQKQRTAMARALVGDPRILVLDDAFSSVDTSTEARIQSRLASGPPRTTIVVAHRVSTVSDADEILVLHEGRLVERGPHAALLAAGGRYAAMHRQQRLEEELAAS